MTDQPFRQRRQKLFVKLIVVLFSGVLTSACSEQNAAELEPVRRIITVEDDYGDALILADGPSANIVTLNGSTISRIWETDEMPVPLSINEDAGENAGNAYREGFTGSSFYIADIPAGSSLEDIPLHKQDSLDYIAVLSGQINLVLEDRTVSMETGDLLVQAGNMHSWTNTSDGPCRLLVVVLTGTR